VFDLFLRNKYSGIIVFVIVTMLTSCSENKQELLKVGSTVWPGYEPLYLGREKGFIKKENVHLVEFLSASQVIQAFRNKAIDLAALTLDEVLLLVNDGFNPAIILVMDFSDGADAIIAKKKYKTFNELKGKKIGYENSALGAYFLSRALDVHAMHADEVILVPMNVNETENSLRQGYVDAVVTFEPSRTRLIESGYSELFNSKKLKNEIVDVMIVRKEVLNQKRKEIQKLIGDWFITLEYFYENKPESMKIMNERLRLSDSGLLTAFNTIRIPLKGENIQMLGDRYNKGALTQVLEKLHKEMVDAKLLKSTIEVEGLSDSSIILGKQ